MRRPRPCPHHPNKHRTGCDPCRAYSREYKRYRDVAIRAGTWTRLVPAARVAEHIRTLAEADMPHTAIARAARVGLCTVRTIAWGRQETCRSDTATAILAVVCKPGNGHWVDGVGTRRRLQALVRSGWSTVNLGAVAGRRSELISRWASKGTVAPSTADLVRELYDRLFDRDGPSPQSAIIAERKGWHPPEAWSDATIDDPKAEPYDWCRDDVDEVAVDQFERGRLRWGALTDAEQREVVRRHVGTAAPTTLAKRWGTARRRVETLVAEVAADAAVAA